MKLPDYEKFLGPQQFGGHEGTTPERVLDVPAYGKACYLAALEEAAKVAGTARQGPWAIAGAIRALKEQIE